MKYRFLKIVSLPTGYTNYSKKQWEGVIQDIIKIDSQLPKLDKNDLEKNQAVIVMVNGFPTFARVQFVGDGWAAAVTCDNKTIIPLTYYLDRFGKYPSGWCLHIPFD